MFKFMLWSSLVFFEHGSMYQLLVAQAICIAQVLVHVQQWPWIRDSENRFHLVWLLLAVVMAAAGTGLNYLDLKVRGGGLHGYYICVHGYYIYLQCKEGSWPPRWMLT